MNASAGFWPIQRFTDSTLAAMDATCARLGIDRVWLSAIESILYPETDAHDLPLFKRLLNFPRFEPVKTVNPLLANWRQSLESAARFFPLSAIKLFPSYHGYSLQDDIMRGVCSAADELSLPVLVQMRVNDERNQPGFMQVPGVNAKSIADLAVANPETLIIALCPYNNDVPHLAAGGDNLLLDVSFLDQSESILLFENEIPLDRIVFGSHAPFMVADSAHMKLNHFELPERLRNGVAKGNLLARLCQCTGV